MRCTFVLSSSHWLVKINCLCVCVCARVSCAWVSVAPYPKRNCRHFISGFWYVLFIRFAQLGICGYMWLHLSQCLRLWHLLQMALISYEQLRSLCVTIELLWILHEQEVCPRRDRISSRCREKKGFWWLQYMFCFLRNEGRIVPADGWVAGWGASRCNCLRWNQSWNDVSICLQMRVYTADLTQCGAFADVRFARRARVWKRDDTTLCLRR